MGTRVKLGALFGSREAGRELETRAEFETVSRFGDGGLDRGAVDLGLLTWGCGWLGTALVFIFDSMFLFMTHDMPHNGSAPRSG